MPEQFFQYPLMQPLIQTLELVTPSQLILSLTVIFIIAVLIAGVVRLTLLYLMTKLLYETDVDLSIDITTVTLDGKSENIDYITYQNLTKSTPFFRENNKIISDRYLKILSSFPWPLYLLKNNIYTFTKYFNLNFMLILKRAKV